MENIFRFLSQKRGEPDVRVMLVITQINWNVKQQIIVIIKKTFKTHLNGIIANNNDPAKKSRNKITTQYYIYSGVM